MNYSLLFQLYNAFPYLLHYLPGNHKEFFKNFTEQKKFILEQVKEHQESLDPNNPRDFIDYFMIKMEKVSVTLILQLHLLWVVMWLGLVLIFSVKLGYSIKSFFPKMYSLLVQPLTRANHIGCLERVPNSP